MHCRLFFFLMMYYAVLFLFGMQYCMVVSLATLLFQVNYKKQHTASSLAYLIIQQLILAVLAYVATFNLTCCLILNLIVPFWLIFSKTSPFNQLGYFSTLMTFTFLQFMPVDLKGFFTQIGAMMFCCSVLFIAIPLYSRLHPEIAVNNTEMECMTLLGTVLEKFFHVKHHRRGADAREIMEQYIYCSDYILNLIQEMLQLKKEKKLHGIDIMKYSRHIDGEPELSRLMIQYAQNLSDLYLLVLKQTSTFRPPAA